MGYCWSLEGCPYLFATADVPSTVTSLDTNWPGSAGTLASGFLRRPQLEWSERVRPLDGDLEVEDIAVVLEDAVVSFGPAAGHRLMTWLTTRAPQTIPATVLAVSMLDTDLTFKVADPSGFPTGAQVVWIDAEAIHCTGRSGDTFTVDLRGYYGSRSADHLIDGTTTYAPEVWTAFPFATGRRAILWHVDAAGVATTMRIDVLRLAPALHESGAPFTAACQHVWTYERELPLGVPTAAANLVGYSTAALDYGFQYDGSRAFTSTLTAAGTPAFTPTIEGAFAYGYNSLRAIVASLSLASNVAFGPPVRNGDGFTWRITTTGLTNPRAYLRIGTQKDSEGPAATSDPRTITCSVSPVPPCLLQFSVGATGQIVPLDNAAGLPTTWPAPYAVNDGPYQTRTSLVLRGAIDDKRDLVVTPTAPGAVDVTNRQITGAVTIEPSQVLGSVRIPTTGQVLIEAPVAFLATAQIQSDHWVHALRRGLVEDGLSSGPKLVRAGLDARDWDWTAAAQLVALTASPLQARTWAVNGTQKLADFVMPELVLAGAGLGVRAGRLAPFAFRQAAPCDAPVATFTSTDLVAPTGFAPLDDGLCNTVKVSTPYFDVVVNDQRSRAKYGPGRVVSVDVASHSVLASAPTPFDVQQYVASRVLGLFAEPAYVATITVHLGWAPSIWHGDLVALTEWLAPDRAGGRGLGNAAALATLGQTDQRGLVIGRKPNTGNHRLTLDLLILRSAPGWSPAARVGAVGSNTVTLATGYLGGFGGGAANADYAGSNLPSYRFAGTFPNDGGTSWFAPGYVVQLFELDNASPATAQTLTVQSINPSTRVVTFTGSLAGTWGTILTGGGTVDLRFAAYGNGSTIAAAQKPFAWVGGEGSNVIGTSFDRAQNWSP